MIHPADRKQHDVSATCIIKKIQLEYDYPQYKLLFLTVM